MMAGFEEEKDILEARQHEELISEKGNETLDIGIVTKVLMGSKSSKQLLPVREDQNVDFAFLVQKGRKKITWNFVVALDEIQNAVSKHRVNAYFYNLGRIVSVIPSDKEQYTMIVHSERDFLQMSKVAELNLVKGRVSVALINIAQKSVMKEASIGPDRAFYSLSVDN